MKKIHDSLIFVQTKLTSANFCADQVDVITNFVVITNVVIKRAHCILFRKTEIRSLPSLLQGWLPL